jgi:hypothetical protein
MAIFSQKNQEISKEMQEFYQKFQRAARVYQSFDWSSPSDKNIYGLHDIEFLKPCNSTNTKTVHAKGKQILSSKMFGLNSPEQDLAQLQEFERMSTNT